ncbi:MAG: TonB-dependent receptor [Acidobacteriaceae bacterium]
MVVDIAKIQKVVRACSIAFLLAVAAIVIVSVVNQPAWAQTNISGDLSGNVTDPTGAAIPNASVTAVNSATGDSKSTVSSGDGSYRLSLLKPGVYKVTIKATGFQSSELQVRIAAGVISQGSVKLAIGQSSTTVQVTEAEPLLHTQSADISTTFTQQQVQSMPNPGNDLTFIAQTAPGAVMNTQGGYGNFSTFGLPATSNTFTVNGSYENDPFLNLNNSGATNLLLGNNDIGDVTVVSNAYGAQYGGLGGSQVNEISRSGGNQFHGDAIWWWNGSVMNANDYFNNQTGTKRPRSNANQWAGDISGPIVKDKTFFFFNTEGLRVIIPVRGTVYAPSPAYMSATLASVAPSDQPFFKNLFSVYTKSPNYATATPDLQDPNAVSYASNSSNFAHEWLMSGRVDQKLTSADDLFVHFKIDKGVQPTFTSLLDPIFNTQSPQPSYEGQLNENHVFSPNIINQFVFAAVYYRAIFTNINQAAANAIAPFTLEWLDGDLGANNSFATELGGLNFVFPQGRNVTGYQFVDDLSVTRGNHNYKMGFAFRRDNVSDYGPSVLAVTPLVLTSEDSFQHGIGDVYIQNFPSHYDQPVSLYTLGWYVQDQWKLKPNFTLTYGIRFEHNSNPVCHNNCYASLANDFSSESTSTATPYNKLINSGLYTAFKDLQKVAYEPRVGFSWSPFGTGTSTVLRGGFGMFADSFPAQIADSLLNNAPVNSEFLAFGGALNPAASGSNASQAFAANQNFLAAYNAGGSYDTGLPAPGFFNAAHKIYYPSYEEWNLELEHEIGHATAIDINYVGNHGYHEPVNANSVNAYNGGVAPGTFPELPANAPNQNFGPVTEVYSGASSNYNGLIISAKHQTKSLTVQVNYAYSHALDEISNGGFDPFSGNSINPSNPYNLRSNYGNADYDTRHYINGSYLYMLPYYGGPHALTDGWEFAGTVFHSNGLPFTVTDTVTGNNIGNYNGGNGGSLLYAKQIVPHVNNACSGGSHVFNNATGVGHSCGFASQFASATDFGQQARNQIYGPHYTDFDFTVLKAFAVPGWESARLKLGVQFFNLFNHPNFGQPVHDINSSANGQVFTTVNPPTSILGSFLGGDASPRLIQFKTNFTF